MKTVVAKVVFAGMLLMWALPFHANAAYPQTCTNPTAYSQCMSGCFSNIGVCFEYCPPSYCMGSCTIFEDDENVYNSQGEYQYTITSYVEYSPSSGCQAYCVGLAETCAANCPSYCN